MRTLYRRPSLSCRKGATLVEYGLLAGLIAAVLIAAITILSQHVSKNLCSGVFALARSSGTYGNADVNGCTPNGLYFSFGANNTAPDSSTRTGYYSLGSGTFSGGIFGYRSQTMVGFGYTLYNNSANSVNVVTPTVSGAGNPSYIDGSCPTNGPLAAKNTCNANFQFPLSTLNNASPGTVFVFVATEPGAPTDSVSLAITN